MNELLKILEKLFKDLCLQAPMNLMVLALSSIAAGFIGALMGIGGGTVIVPLLTAVFGVDVKEAIAVSIVCVIATGIAGASRYIKQNITNIRLAMFLEVSTTAGALSGALLTIAAPRALLYLILSLILFYLSVSQVLTSRKEEEMVEKGEFAKLEEDLIARKLGLSGSYYDLAERIKVEYKVRRSLWGLAASYIAGLTSGLLGIGGGVLKVSLMNQLMNIPIKASIGTSKMMIGITASAGAAVYFLRGMVNTSLVAPIALGVTLGASIGTFVMNRLKVASLKRAFGVLLLYFAYAMMAKCLYMITGIALPGVRL